MFREYFNIIRKALSEGREKKAGTYYELHHIVPKSFGKKSSLVLLTAEEHYTCHKILATNFRHHPVYGRKMLWAFHRLSYDGKRTITAQEYTSGKELLLNIWCRKFSDEHKEKIAETRRGKKTMVNLATGEQKYVNKDDVKEYVVLGWVNSHKAKGRKMSDKQKKFLSELRKQDLKGRVGINARASKGVVVYENEDGTKIEAGSALQLGFSVGIPQATIAYRLINNPDNFYKGWKVYYKNKQ